MRRAPSRFPRAAAAAAVLCFALRPGSAGATTTDFGKGLVAGDRVNVRAAAQGESQVLGQLDSGARGSLAGPADDAWVKVFLPESFDVWIYAPLVKDAGGGRREVGVKRAQLRAGPGLQHASVGMADRGEALEVRGTSGEWVRVSPKGLSAFGYVTNLYVKAEPRKAPEAPKAGPPPSPAPPPEPPRPAPAPVAPPPPAPALVSAPQAPAVPSGEPAAPPSLAEDVPAAAPERTPGTGRDVATAAPSAKPRRTLLSSETPTPIGPAGIPSTRLRGDVAQAGAGSFAGTLARSPAFGAHPTRWRLVRFVADDAAPQTVCYVHGNEEQLSGLRNRQLVVSGAVYWFRGTGLPAIYAQDIVLGK